MRADEMGHLTEFEQLEKHLHLAKIELGTSGQRAARAAVEALMHFLLSIPRFHDQELWLPLLILHAALEDLERGVVAPILRPSKVRRKRGDTTLRGLVKASAEMCIDMLHQAGVPLDRACQLVTRELKACGVRIGGRPDGLDWKTVKGWRDRISKLPSENDERRTLEALRLGAIREDPSSQEAAERHVKDLLRHVRKIWSLGLGLDPYRIPRWSRSSCRN